MPRIVIVIDGPDTEKALGELISNAEYDKLIVAIWTADNPDRAIIRTSTLVYQPIDQPNEVK